MRREYSNADSERYNDDEAVIAERRVIEAMRGAEHDGVPINCIAETKDMTSREDLWGSRVHQERTRLSAGRRTQNGRPRKVR